MLSFYDSLIGPKRASCTCRKWKFDGVKVNMSVSYKRTSYWVREGFLAGQEEAATRAIGVFLRSWWYWASVLMTRPRGQAVCSCSHFPVGSLSQEKYVSSSHVSIYFHLLWLFYTFCLSANDPYEHHEDGGWGEGDKNIDILFGDMMGKDILRPTIQEERKRTSILLGGINVWAAFCPAGERPRLI